MKDTNPPTQTKQPTLRFDWQDWMHHLADEDIPDHQKRELIKTLWSIVIGFVDLGWDIKSTPESCGEDADLYTLLTSVMVDFEDAQTGQTEGHHE